MKKLMIIVAVAFFAMNVFAFAAEETQQCKSECYVVGYDFGHQWPRPVCYQIEHCRIYKWDSVKEECVYDKTEEKKWRIACRDIPPAF